MATFVTSFALAGSRVSLTGGLYAYVEVAFGPFIGFLAGVLFFLTAVVSVSGIVSLFTGSFLVLLPSLDSSIGHFLIALLVFGVLAGVNVRGVRGGTRAVEVVTIIKLLPLLFFVGMGIFFIKGSDAVALAWPSGGTASCRSFFLTCIRVFALRTWRSFPFARSASKSRSLSRSIFFVARPRLS